MNSKKKKRLEKYIDKKLKKEERIVLFEKLSQSQAQLKSTLHLQSSSTLGTGKHSTAHERIEKEEDRETRKIIEGKGLGKRKRGAGERFDAVDDEDEDDNDLDAGLPSGGLTVGSALVVAPRISSKKRGGNKVRMFEDPFNRSTFMIYLLDEILKLESKAWETRTGRRRE